MQEREIERWITVNGKHIPIYKGESVDEQRKRKQIEQNEQSAKTLNRLSSDADESKLRDELREKLLDKDSYMNSEEYKMQSSTVQKLWNEMQKLKDRQRELWEIKKKGTTIDEDTLKDFGGDRQLAELFGKKDAKAEAAEKELKTIREEISKAEDNWSRASDKLENYHKEHGRKNLDESSISTNVKSSYEGFEKDTHTSYYQDLYKQGKAFIVEMSPRTYLEYCGAKIFETSYEKQVQAVSADAKNTYKLADMMKDGTKMYMPALDFKRKEQEGRHRAAAAILNGIDKIPVMIVR